MKDRIHRRDFLLAAGIIIGGAGCRLRSAPLPRRTFLLEAPRPETASSGKGAGVLLVRPFRVSPAFESRAFVLRRGETEYIADAYHAFLLSPGAMLTEAVAGWIRSLSVFATVTTGGSQVAPTHMIEGEVGELYADYRDPAQPKARLAVQFRLLYPLGGARPAVQWQRDERRAVALPSAGAEELVAGWNQALGEVCRALQSELLQRPPDTGSHA